MVKDREVSEAMAQFVGGRISGNFTGSVTEVDKENAVVTVEFNKNQYTVKLRSIIDGTVAGLVLFPAVDSQIFCVAEGNSKNRYYAAGFEKIDAFSLKIDGAMVDVTSEGVSLKIDDTTMEATSEGIVFNGGALNGLVKLDELKSNLESLKNYVEAINSALPQAFNAVGASTAASGALGATAYNASMAGKMISLKDMENTKIKQ